MRVPQQAGAGIAKIVLTLAGVAPKQAAPATIDAMLIGDKVDIPTLTAAFKQADPAIRHEILGAIWEFSIRVPEVVEVVVLGLADKDSRVKTRAMRIAGSLRTIDDRVLALLIEALADKDDYVRSQSARTLKRIGGPAAKAAVPTLKRPE